MDTGTNGRVFRYHADANPFGGSITAPVVYTISTQASSSVSEGGGHVHASVGSYQVMNAISVASAASEIYGLPNTGAEAWESHVSSCVQKINLLDVVTADEIVCSFTVRHPYDEAVYYPSVDFTQCAYTNLRVNGQLITPKLDTQQFSRTKDQVAANPVCWLDDSDLIGKVCTQNQALMNGAPSWLQSRYSWVPITQQRQRKGHAVCSLVQGFAGVGAGVNAYGHVLEVAGFGRLFFGELTVYQGSFGVTMLRAEIDTTATMSAPSPAPTGGPEQPVPAPPPPPQKSPGTLGTVAVAVAHTNASPSP